MDKAENLQLEDTFPNWEVGWSGLASEQLVKAMA